METRTVFFIGKPGSGKGVQTKLLSEKTSWTAFSSGDLFREIAKENTPVGRKVKKNNDAGDLQPAWLAMYLYLKSLFSVSQETGLIFDGFNRTVHEANLVMDSLTWLNRSFIVINIIVSDEVVRTRLSKRKETEGRADDEVVEERLKEYHQFTEPVLELFRSRSVLIDVDGEQSPHEVAEQVHKILKLA